MDGEAVGRGVGLDDASAVACDDDGTPGGITDDGRESDGLALDALAGLLDEQFMGVPLGAVVPPLRAVAEVRRVDERRHGSRCGLAGVLVDRPGAAGAGDVV